MPAVKDCRLGSHLPRSQPFSEIISPRAAIYKTDGNGLLWAGEGSIQGPELPPTLCSPAPTPAAALSHPQTPRLQGHRLESPAPMRPGCHALPASRAGAKAVHTPPGPRREKKNDLRGSSRDMLPCVQQCPHSILTPWKELPRLLLCPVKPAHRQAPLQATRQAPHITASIRGVTAWGSDPYLVLPPL